MLRDRSGNARLAAGEAQRQPVQQSRKLGQGDALTGAATETAQVHVQQQRALQRAASGRIAACWYSSGLVGGSFSIDINLTDGAAHRVALYLVDWDVNGREMRVDVLDAATQHVLTTQTVQSFHAGIYLEWNLRGHVILRFTSTGGTNAVLSGIFFDAPNRSPVPDRPMVPQREEQDEPF
jgi:hypothetical protein